MNLSHYRTLGLLFGVCMCTPGISQARFYSLAFLEYNNMPSQVLYDNKVLSIHTVVASFDSIKRY